MQTVDLNVFIPLILIKEIESFRDSYSLTKVLAWKFDIISIVNVVNTLKTEDLIKATFENGVEHYEVTSKGLKYIEANLVEGKKLLLDKYAVEQNFINSILS